MKKILALVLLLALVVMPTLSFTSCGEPKEAKLENLIIIIGDGMGVEHIEAGAAENGVPYQFESWNNIRVNTDSKKNKKILNYLTDSAAAATTLATGVQTKNSRIGTDYDGNELTTIMDLAIEKGKATGIVTTDNLFGATPAGFSAHALEREDAYNITRTQFESGINYFAGVDASGEYDKEKYDSMFETTPYYVTKDIYDKQIKKNDYVFIHTDIETGVGANVSLKDSTMEAIKFLEKDKDGFVLMIEQAYIDKCSHGNEFDNMLYRMQSLGETVDAVMEWIGKRSDTAVIVTADHETGGLFVNEDKENNSIYESENGEIAYLWTSDNHTQSEVGLFVYGYEVDFTTYETYTRAAVPNEMGKIPEGKRGYATLKNTEVFNICKEILTMYDEVPVESAVAEETAA